MKSLKTLLILAALFASAAHAQSTINSGSGAMPMDEAKKEAAKPSSEMADGEIRKVDKEASKLTIRHGELKDLGMPPMTMVFRVQDKAMLSRVAAGDKVRFTAEKIDGALTVTSLESVK